MPLTHIAIALPGRTMTSVKDFADPATSAAAPASPIVVSSSASPLFKGQDLTFTALSRLLQRPLVVFLVLLQ